MFIYLLADTQTAANNAKERSLNENIANYLFKRMKYLNKHKYNIGQYKNVELYYVAVVLTLSSLPSNIIIYCISAEYHPGLLKEWLLKEGMMSYIQGVKNGPFVIAFERAL